MTNEEVMQLMTDMGLHEGGIENWVMDNAWVLVVNKAIEKEREACAKEADKRLHDYTMLTSNPPQSGAAWSIASAIRARGQA
jgi:hypothetical protein